MLEIIVEFIVEFITEIIFEGALGILTEKRVSAVIRIGLAVLLLGIFLGLSILLLYIGIKHRSGIVQGIAIFLLVMVAIGAVRKYNEMRK